MTFFANNCYVIVKLLKVVITTMTRPICVESCKSLNKKLTDDATLTQLISKE